MRSRVRERIFVFIYVLSSLIAIETICKKDYNKSSMKFWKGRALL